MNKMEKAPDFELVDTDLKKTRLSELKGSPVILAFFPGAFTSVCSKEMCTFRDSMAKFNKFRVKVLGISVDHPFSLSAFKQQNNLNFTLLSDFNKEVSAKYGGLHEDFAGIKGLKVSKRSVFILDKDGNIVYKWISENPGVEPNYKEIEDAISKLN